MHLELFDDSETLTAVHRAYEAVLKSAKTRFTGQVVSVSGVGTPIEVRDRIVARLAARLPHFPR